MHNPNSRVAAAQNPAVDSFIQEFQQELLLWQAATQALHAAGLTARAEQQVRTVRSLVLFLQHSTADATAGLKTYPADAPALHSAGMQAADERFSAGTVAARSTAADNGTLQCTLLSDPELTSAGMMPHAAEAACAAQGSLEALYDILPDTYQAAGGPCNTAHQAKCSTSQAGVLADCTTAATAPRTPRAGPSGPAVSGLGTQDHPVTFASKLWKVLPGRWIQQALQPPYK